MRELLTRVLGLLGALIGGSLLLAAPVLAVEGDTLADAALGQPDLISNACNNGGVSARSLCNPSGVAMDPTSGRLFVADTANNRVLGFANSRRFARGEAAELVLGQPDFLTTSCEGVSDPRHNLCRPSGVAVDQDGRLYVADSGSGRVLRFNEPRATGQAADLVLGQPDFASTPTFVSAGSGGGCITPGLCIPTGVATDRAGRLYVSDEDRGVMRFDHPESNGQPPDLVVADAATPFSGRCTVTFCAASGLAVSPQGTLYVADAFRHRILRFTAPVAGQAPDLVLGQPDFSIDVRGFKIAPGAMLAG